MDKAELAVNEMVKKYDPHTVIVYGSRARGDRRLKVMSISRVY